MATAFTYLSIVISLLVVLLVLPSWIRTAFKLRFTGKDINKHKKVEVAEAGGVSVILGFVVGYFIYAGFLVFFYGVNTQDIILSFAAITALLLAGFIGFVDDIIGWRIGLKKSYKVLLTIFIPLPLMVLNAGYSIMNLPFIGSVDFGLFFPLVLVPLAIIGTTNGFNMLAGYNGLEGGLGIIILSSLGVISNLQGLPHISGLCFIMVAALLGFLYFNKYPASVFPGDTLTYAVGAMIGVVAILANIEKFALILFIPYFLEFILKARTRFQKASWANASKGGTLKNMYGKWYGLPNVAISLLNKMKSKAREWEVVAVVWIFELVFVAITFLSYYEVIPL